MKSTGRGRPCACPSFVKHGLVALLLLTGCGGIKNTNPLQGLAGPADASRYGFESTDMGWASIVAPASSVDSVFQSPQMSFYGAGSLGFHVTSMGNTDGTAARIGV